MSDDFDYSIKFPTLPFNKPNLCINEFKTKVPKESSEESLASDSDDESQLNYRNISCPEKEPVVILLGWLGCKDSYLSKYGNVYYQNGCVVIQYIPIPDDIFFNQKRVREHAYKLLELLEEMCLLENPLFIHIFSNAGAIVYAHILDLLKMKKSDGNPEIVGVIWDSSPGKSRLNSAKRAYLSQMPNVSGILRTVVGIVFIIVFVIFRLCNSVLSIFDKKRNPNLYKRLQTNVLSCPQLFLYSKCDDIIYYKDIEEMIGIFKKKGCAVTTLSWEDSDHVQHFRNHPDSYAKQCIHFLQSCVSHI